eukprot:3329032-Pleurochrysis_carterae.AAC.1
MRLMRPSTGFVTVLLARSMCSKVSLFGMGDPGECKGFHYYEKQKKTCNVTSNKDEPFHWFEMEHALYRTWQREGHINLFS